MSIDSTEELANETTTTPDTAVESQSSTESTNSTWTFPEGEPAPDADAPEQGAEGSSASADDSAVSGEGVEKEGAAAQPSLSPQDIEDAHRAGFSDDDIRRLGITNRDQLEYVAGVIWRRQQAVAQQQAQVAQSQQQAAPQQIPAPAQQAPVQSAIDWSALEQADVEPTIIQSLKAMEARLSGVPQFGADQVMQQVSQYVEPIQRMMHEIQMERFDNYIASLGADWKDVFGDGPTDALSRDSKEFKARSRLWDAANIISNGSQVTGGYRQTATSLWQRGLNQEFGSQQAEKAASREKARIKAGVEKQRNRMIVPPNGVRRSPAGPNRFSNMESKAAELGITFDADEEE